MEKTLMKDGVDVTMTEGAAAAYAIPNVKVSVHVREAGVPTLWWRSVGHTHTAYATEAFLDQVAAEAGQDELALRRQLLAGHPRHLGVLNLAAEKAGWGTPLPKGVARGVAVHESFHSFVAHVVEVSLASDGMPKVERVVAAVDCGQPINPGVIRAQIEGGMGFGVSAAYREAIDLEDGRVVQSNFDSYQTAADRRDAENRGVYRPVHGKAHGHRRTRRPHHSARHCQRLGKAHRQADLRPAVRPPSRQGLKGRHRHCGRRYRGERPHRASVASGRVKA